MTDEQAPIFKLIGVIDSKQGQARKAEWLADELAEFVADETIRRGTWMEISRNEPRDGIKARIYHHPLDEAAVRLQHLRRSAG